MPLFKAIVIITVFASVSVLTISVVVFHITTHTVLVSSNNRQDFPLADPCVCKTLRLLAWAPVQSAPVWTGVRVCIMVFIPSPTLLSLLEYLLPSFCSFLKAQLLICLFNVRIFCLHACLHVPSAHRSQKGFGCPGSGIADRCECWEWSLGKPQLPLTAEPSL